MCKTDTQNNYIAEIDVWKFIFALLIVFSHGIFLADTEAGDKLIFGRALVGVEFYFVISGYFLMQTIYARRDSTLIFIKKRIARLLPYWIPSFIFCMVAWLILKIVFEDYSEWKFLAITLKGFWEFIGFNASGVSTAGINGTWWYLSAMLFGEWLLYPIINKYESQYVSYILPISLFLLIGFMSSSYGTLAGGELAGFINSHLLRALIGLEVGTAVFYFTNALKKYDFNKIRSFWKMVEYLLLFLIFLIAYKNTSTVSSYVDTQLDFVVIYLVFFAVSIIILTTTRKAYNVKNGGYAGCLEN